MPTKAAPGGCCASYRVCCGSTKAGIDIAGSPLLRTVSGLEGLSVAHRDIPGSEPSAVVCPYLKGLYFNEKNRPGLRLRSEGEGVQERLQRRHLETVIRAVTSCLGFKLCTDIFSSRVI